MLVLVCEAQRFAVAAPHMLVLVCEAQRLAVAAT
jgi:hypothetical protein